MAAKSASGCGWIVAALLLIGLLSQCGKDVELGAGAPATGLARQEEWRYIQPISANCRSGPSTSNPITEKLNRNSFVGVIQRQESWSLLDRPADCWVRSDLLGTGPTSEPTPVRSLMGGSGGGRSQATTGQSSHRSSGSTYYANCSAARAAGAAPVLASDPGYSRRLDRDGDGVGCE